MVDGCQGGVAGWLMAVRKELLGGQWLSGRSCCVVNGCQEGVAGWLMAVREELLCG